jgi:hypothetical protein
VPALRDTGPVSPNVVFAPAWDHSPSCVMSPPDPSSCGTLQSGMSSQSKRVLVVDNNDEESQVLASLLDDAGYRSTTTWSGLEALELLESQEFDIVLVSSYLPDIYVGDFFERFHRLPVRPCVIVMQEGQAVRSMIGKELPFEE